MRTGVQVRTEEGRRPKSSNSGETTLQVRPKFQYRMSTKAYDRLSLEHNAEWARTNHIGHMPSIFVVYSRKHLTVAAADERYELSQK